VEIFKVYMAGIYWIQQRNFCISLCEIFGSDVSM